MLVIFYGHGKRNGSRARAPYIHTYMTELNNAERSVVRNAGDRARTRLGDWAGLAGYLKWPVFVGFSRTVNNSIG